MDKLLYSLEEGKITFMERALTKNAISATRMEFTYFAFDADNEKQITSQQRDVLNASSRFEQYRCC